MRAALLLLLALVLPGCAAPILDAEVAPEGAALVAEPAAQAGAPRLSMIAQANAPGGYALRVHESRAYVATFTTLQGVSVFDVADPAQPVLLGGTPPGVLARSVDVLDYGERVAVAISTGSDLEIWELTDPETPTRLAAFPIGSHNVVVHPEARIVYNARNLWDDLGGAMEIIDARDPDTIRLARTWAFPARAQDGTLVANQGGCHDLTFDVATDRAYCAAYQQTLVLDVKDPLAPVVVTTITNPLITDHHSAFTILGGTVLAIGDEWAYNAVWGCAGHPLAGLPQAPVGALWFYDLTTPKPEILGYVAAPTTPPDATPFRHGINAMCTSHNGVELGEGTGLVAYAWFKAGILLIDASDPRAPVVLEAHDVAGAFGDARFAAGHVFAADDEVGLHVFRLD